MPSTLANAVKFDRGSPTIAIVNESSDVDVRELRKAVKAFQKQLDRDFFPRWGWRADLIFEQNIPPRSMRLTIKEVDSDPEDEGLLGYHILNGVPITEVFTRDTNGKRFREYYSVISHEILEMIADPSANLYADGYLNGNEDKAALIAFEVCDPVQDRLYAINGIKVSDFVTPEWFEPGHKPGSVQFSHLGSVNRPFKMTPGGYVDAVFNGKADTFWGKSSKKGKRRRRVHARKTRGHIFKNA
jgi:hypothetical protein